MWPTLRKIKKLFLTLGFLDKHNQLLDDQFAFRKGKSTMDTKVRLINMVTEGLDNNNLFINNLNTFDE